MAEPAAYVILAHGTESLSAMRQVVPDGSLLVLSEECGRSGSLPTHIYDMLMEQSNMPHILDPISHTAELSALFQKPLRIYRPGDEYPALSYTLVNYDFPTGGDGDVKTVYPSGVQRLPLAEIDVVANPENPAKRYEFPTTMLIAAYAGSVVPAPMEIADVKDITELKRSPAVHITQQELFARAPGIHYNFICRELTDPVMDEIRQILRDVFPERARSLRKVLHEEEGADIIDLVAEWMVLQDLTQMSLEESDAISTLQGLLMSVKERRDLSAEKQPRIGAPSELWRKIAAAIYTNGSVMEYLSLLPVAEADIPDPYDGKTLLMMAANKGLVDVVQRLLDEFHADPRMADWDGDTVMHYAAAAPTDLIVKIVLNRGVLTDSPNATGITSLHAAAMNPVMTDMLPILSHTHHTINAQDEGGYTALHYAAELGHSNNVKALLELGADSMIPTEEGLLPIHLAIEEGYEPIARTLLSAPNIDIEYITPSGKHIFGMALNEDMEDLCVALLRKGYTLNSIQRRRVQRIARDNDMTTLLSVLKQTRSQST